MLSLFNGLSLLLGADPGAFETVVTGTRTERALKDTPVLTEVLRREDLLANGADNLATALDDHPGLEVTRSFSGAGLRIRGLDPQYVLVLIDGERVSGRVNGTIRYGALMVEEGGVITGNMAMHTVGPNLAKLPDAASPTPVSEAVQEKAAELEEIRSASTFSRNQRRS